MILEKETFGSILRDARESRGVSLQQVAELTKVPSELWRDLERSDVAYWPEHLNAPRYMRQYAEAVGLDPDFVADEFSRLFPEIGDRVEPLLRAHQSLVHELDIHTSLDAR
jgi:cytoskeleton protein RodZ